MDATHHARADGRCSASIRPGAVGGTLPRSARRRPSQGKKNFPTLPSRKGSAASAGDPELFQGCSHLLRVQAKRVVRAASGRQLEWAEIDFEERLIQHSDGENEGAAHAPDAVVRSSDGDSQGV